MNGVLPVVYIARHGETAWSLSGQYTGRTDLPLTDRGERTARRLGERLEGTDICNGLHEPLATRHPARVRSPDMEMSPSLIQNLVEWNYGQYEGRRTAEIVAERPGWQLFVDGCPGGESPGEVAVRGRPGDRPTAYRRGQRASIFERALYSRLGGCWSRARADVQRRYFASSTASLSVGLRTRAFRVRDPALE